MYVPEHFAMSPEQVAQVLTGRRAGDLVTTGPEGLRATFLPFSFTPEVGRFGALRTHLGKVNQQWADEGEALVILHGPDGYISPTHQPPSQTVMPTWNYLTVQVRGRLSAHHDPEWKLAGLRELVAANESVWTMAEVSDEYLERFLPAMVGVQIEITSIEGKAKLSQDKSVEYIDNVTAALERSGHGAELSGLMKELARPVAQRRWAEIARLRLR